jgi:hypothetical protein
MSDYIFTAHAKDMLKERDIREEWVLQTIRDPDRTRKGNDNNTHYFKLLPEREGNILHVVVNENVEQKRIVTLFLDRRERKGK